jgi:ATP-dependent DNA helicase RecG
MVNLLELIKRPEGKTLGFKRDLSSPKPLLRTLVASANTAGGMLLVGMEDKTNSICGVRDPLSDEERLANMISDRIVPRPVPNIELLTWRKTHVIAINVCLSPARPYHLKGQGPQNGVFVRVGSTNRQADGPLQEEMRRSAKNRSFDKEPMGESNTEAIDFRVASVLFRQVRKLLRKDLRVLHLVTD